MLVLPTVAASLSKTAESRVNERLTFRTPRGCVNAGVRSVAPVREPLPA